MAQLEDLEIPTIGYGTPEIRVLPSPKRLRAFAAGGVQVVDSKRVQLMLEPGRLPVYYFPKQDVRMDLLTPRRSEDEPGRKGPATLWTLTAGDLVVEDALFSFEETPENAPELAGLISMYWSRMERIFEEEEEVFAHARDPAHRIETLRTSRHIEVMLDGQTLAETNRGVMLIEPRLPIRYYIPKLDCRFDLLDPSPTTSVCPYKGFATEYWSASGIRDVAWCYPAPLLECAQIANLVAFFSEKVEIYVDGELLPKLITPWST